MSGCTEQDTLLHAMELGEGLSEDVGLTCARLSHEQEFVKVARNDLRIHLELLVIEPEVVGSVHGCGQEVHGVRGEERGHEPYLSFFVGTNIHRIVGLRGL